jgi:hypothetical protein
VRWFTALVIAVSACGGSAEPARVAPPPAPKASVALAAPSAPQNTVGLVAKELDTPISPARVRFAAPSFGEHIAPAEAQSYDVRWVSDNMDVDALGVDVALDGQRPRRIPGSASLITLGLLVPTDEALALGEHWLFAAPISASGLVPRRTAESPRSAVALRFVIGDGAPGAASTSGALWLRKPDGTYNGAGSEQVLIDAQAFAESGTPLASPCAIHVRGAVTGELNFPGPFLLLALLNGDYELTASTPGAPPSLARLITVNRELGRPK